MEPSAIMRAQRPASDPDRFWLTRDYLPEHAGLWAGRPSLTELAGAIAARIGPDAEHPLTWFLRSHGTDRRRHRWLY